MALHDFGVHNNLLQEEKAGNFKSVYNKKIGKVPEVATLNDLIRELYTVFDSDHVNIEYVHALMSAYKSNPADWRRFAKFDRYKYTRNLVDAGNGKFNLMILCWGEGQGSLIHDHANAHCFMKMLQGELTEIRFEWPKEEETIPTPARPNKMVEISRTALLQNEVCYINDSIGLHRVENPSHSDVAISLHLYCPPFQQCAVFDLRTGQKSISTVTFWSIHGHRKKSSQEKEETKKLMEV